MPFIYRDFTLTPRDSEAALTSLLADRLAVRPELLSDLRIMRKAVDARKKNTIRFVYTIMFSADVSLHQQLSRQPSVTWQPEPVMERLTRISSSQRIVIVGSGPAGLFAALRLAQYGLTATVLERGEPVELRTLAVQRFWKEGLLNPESNVQFGEGGAGTFSDGKLTCRSKDPLIPWVLQQLIEFGAQPEIGYLAKPHIGTDRLRTVVVSIRQHLIASGFSFRFNSRMSDLLLKDGVIRGVVLNDHDEISCDQLILACGHSARDTYQLLEHRQVPLQRKPFAMGLRVEHPQELINRIQYGATQLPNLPVADYAVTYNNTTTGRSAYSFCMCPGGVVVGGSSEAGGVVTNGMSSQLRNSPYANSALVVTIRDEDFDGPGPLGGVRLQRRWEQQAYRAGGSGYRAPAQNLLDFLGRPGAGGTSASYRPGITVADLSLVLPRFVIDTLREGIIDFGRRLKGFVSAEATLIGIESRTSSPVRVLRDSSGESVGVTGLYPAGEGAGYAGGIMSSAVDGIKIADVIAGRLAAGK